MSDPDAVRESTPPLQPPRPTTQRMGSTPISQLEADEQYARQLAEHYGGYGEDRPRATSGGPGVKPRRQQTSLNPNEFNEENRSFLDDDLPIIRENLKKGFLETQSKVNGWITNLRKKIDGEDEDGPQQGYNTGSSSTQYRGRRSGDGRQSGDYGRYDADPHVLSDDFAGIQLNPDGSESGLQGDCCELSNWLISSSSSFNPTSCKPRSLQTNSCCTKVLGWS